MEKVAIINSVIDYGSTGQLAHELYKYAKKNEYEAYVFYGRGKKSKDKNIIKIDYDIEVFFHKVLTLLTGYQGYFSNHATNKLIKYISKLGISKVILLNIHGYYLNEKKILNFLKQNKIKTIYVTPDEYPGLGKCCYNEGCDKYQTECYDCPQKARYPKSLFFDRSNRIFNDKKEVYDGFSSLELVGPLNNIVKFKKSALTKNIQMKELSWGIDLELYNYCFDEHIYDKYKIPKDKIIILTVAKYSSEVKGVKKYFFETAKKLENTKFHFINVGYDGNLNSEEIPKNMTLINYINDQKELTKIYSIADLYLLCSTSDTMPLSCLIALACKTPISCFYTSGLKYLVDEWSIACKFIKSIDVDSVVNVIITMHKKDKKAMIECRKVAENKYSIKCFTKKVFELLEN